MRRRRRGSARRSVVGVQGCGGCSGSAAFSRENVVLPLGSAPTRRKALAAASAIRPLWLSYSQRLMRKTMRAATAKMSRYIPAKAISSSAARTSQSALKPELPVSPVIGRLCKSSLRSTIFAHRTTCVFQHHRLAAGKQQALQLRRQGVPIGVVHGERGSQRETAASASDGARPGARHYVQTTAPEALAPQAAVLLGQLCLVLDKRDAAFAAGGGLIVSAPTNAPPMPDQHHGVWRRRPAEAAKLAAQLCLSPAERSRLPPRPKL